VSVSAEQMGQVEETGYAGQIEPGVVEYDPSAATFQLLLDQDPHPALRPHLERLAHQNDIREAAGPDTEASPASPEISPEHHRRHVEAVADFVPEGFSLPAERVDAAGAALEVGDEALGRQVGRGFFRRMSDRWRRRHAGSMIETSGDVVQSESAEIIPEPASEPEVPATPRQRLEAMFHAQNRFAEEHKDISAAERIAVISATLESLVADGEVLGAYEKRVIVANVGDLASHVREELLAQQIESGEDVTRANSLMLSLLECNDKVAALRFSMTYREYARDLGFSEEKIDEDLDGHEDVSKIGSIEQNLLKKITHDWQDVRQPEAVARLRQLAEASQRYGLRNVPLELAASLPVLGASFREIAEPVYGKNLLRMADRPDLPPRLRQLVESPRFNTRALEFMLVGQSGEDAAEYFSRRDEVAEIVLTEELGYSRPLADALKTSLVGRRSGPMGEAAKLSDLMERGHDTERSETLFKTFDIANFDRYTEQQQDMMYRLAKGDQALIAELRAKKTVLAVTDGLYDGTTVFDKSAEMVSEVHGDDVLFAEAMSLDTFDKLREVFGRLGIEPSALIISGHGSPDGITLGKGKIGSFGRGKVQDTALVRFVNEAMQPDVNGEVNVAFISCSLARAEDQYSTSVIHKVTDATGAVGWGMLGDGDAGSAPLGDGRKRIGFGQDAQRFEKTPDGIRQTAHRYVDFDPNEKKAA